MAQAEDCATYVKELCEILDAPNEGSVVGQLTGHLRKWQKSIIDLLHTDFGRTDSALCNEEGRQIWRLIAQKVPETLVILKNLFHSQRIVIPSEAALQALEERITYYAGATDLLRSTLSRGDSPPGALPFRHPFSAGQQLAKDHAELGAWICGMLKVAHPASLRDGPHAEAKGALIVNEEDWPDPTGRTLANIYPQIRRELGINAGASSNGDHDRRTRVAIFALVKLHIVLQQPPSSVRSLSHGIKILSAAHACALAAFDLPSTQVAPTLWTLHFIVLEQSMNELRALERFLSSSPGHDGSPLIYAFDLSDPTDDILDALIATMSPEEPNSLSQKGLHNSSQAQEGIVEPDTITLPDPSVPHAINTKVDTAQYSADAISAYSHDKEVPTDKPMILRVAQHDPKKLLKDLRWSQARVRIFALNEDRHTRYRIVFEREGCLTTYDVTPHTDRLVLGYAFNIQPSAIWFLKDEKPNYCFASCNAGKDGLHEDLLTFQADLMAPIIPIHFPFVSSVAFQDGHTVFQRCQEVTIQIWRSDGPDTTPPVTAAQSVASRSPRSTIHSSLSRIFIFSPEAIFDLPVNEEIAIKSETVATDIVIGNRSRKKKLSIYRLCMEDNQLPGLVVDSNHSDRPQSIAKLKLSCSTVNISFPNKRTREEFAAKLQDCIEIATITAQDRQRQHEFNRSPIIESTSSFQPGP